MDMVDGLEIEWPAICPKCRGKMQWFTVSEDILQWLWSRRGIQTIPECPKCGFIEDTSFECETCGYQDHC
jgi:hypothetical protein